VTEPAEDRESSGVHLVVLVLCLLLLGACGFFYYLRSEIAPEAAPGPSGERVGPSR
jgi:hypothetical protein